MPQEPARPSTPVREPCFMLRDLDADTIVALLAGEEPDDVAAVLRHLPADVGAAVLAGVPREHAGFVAARLAALDAFDPADLVAVEVRLAARVLKLPVRRPQTAGPEALLAAMALLGDEDTDAILDGMEAASRAAASDVRRRLFRFADLLRLDDRDLQRVLRDTSLQDLAISLAGADERIARHILGNVSTRKREMLHEEAGYARPEQADVAAARARIVALVRRLQAIRKIGAERDADATA